MSKHRRTWRVVACEFALASCTIVGPPSVSAQTEARQVIRQVTGQELSQGQILERLRSSGVGREEARARLRAAGYDPALVDPYFDRLERGDSALGSRDDGFLEALGKAGILQPGATSSPAAVGGVAPPDSFPAPAANDTIPAIFGLDIFRRATDQFEPVATGPVDPDYRLGPRDQIVLILTGDVELAYTLDVTREGFIVIPDVGQISVNGLTLEGLRERLYDRLKQVYSGVTRGPDASTRFDVSLGRLRANQVFVIGDVARPGAYQVSSVGTVLTALYRAGGPTRNGSFRKVTVLRGGQAVAEVDLYDYLLRGDASHDVRLEQGDIVFVPPVGAQVTLAGRVRRPAIFEVSPEESLTDVVRFAGGVLPEAYVQRVQVDRILPPVERRPGRDRVLLDAAVAALDAGASEEAFRVEGGDRITVFGVLERERGRVTLKGAVWRPGSYEFTPGMTVGDLIARADGVTESAYMRSAHVRRLIPETGATKLLRVALAAAPDGRVDATLPIEDLDEVTVFDVDSLRASPSADVLGEVRQPGRVTLDQGATAEDLILSAGGLTPRADPLQIVVSRLRRGATRSDTLTILYPVRLALNLPRSLGENRYEKADGEERSIPWAHDFAIEDGDQVIVRGLSGWVEPAQVNLTGEVLFPGVYTIASRAERLSSVVGRAGGLTAQAYGGGARLMRDSVLMAINLPEAIAHPGGEADILVRSGDELVIPEFDPSVIVTGRVVFPVRVAYQSGRSVGDYLGNAGGPEADAELDRISVEYPSGRRALTRNLLFWRRYPHVEPGSRIYVPTRAQGQGTNWDEFFTRTLSLTTTLLTVMVAANQLK